MKEGPGSDRHEPLPDISRLPRWLWSRLSRRGRVLVGILTVAPLVVVALLLPGIQESKDEKAARELRETAARQAALRRRLEREARPVTGSGDREPRSDHRSRRLSARAALLGSLQVDITREARRRARSGELSGRIKRTDCEPYPRQADPKGAEADLSRRVGLYSCVAVTSDIPPSQGARAGVVGHPFRARVVFGSGRYAFCKVSGRPAEGSLTGRSPIRVPRACGS